MSTHFVQRAALSCAVTKQLLEQNGTVTFGAWVAQPAHGEVGVTFAARIPADAVTLALRSAIHGVATTVDAMEKEPTAQDESECQVISTRPSLDAEAAVT